MPSRIFLIIYQLSTMNNTNPEGSIWLMPEQPDKPWRIIDWGWHPHKKARDKRSKKISKMERFRYFRKKHLPKLMKFFQSKAIRFTNDSHEFGSQIGLVWKTINSKGKEPSRWEHQYVIHFCRVANHRKKPMLVKLYECTTNNLWQVKLELTYQSPQKARNSNSKKLRWLGGRNLIKKISAMKEVQNKFDRRFPWWKDQEFTDHSHYSIDDDVFDEIEQTLEDSS